MVDEGTKRSLQSIPLLQTRASPRDKELWVQRLKEELMALIKVTSLNTLMHCIFNSFISFSMFKATKHPIQIGFDWSPTRKAQNGLENAGMSTIY